MKASNKIQQSVRNAYKNQNLNVYIMSTKVELKQLGSPITEICPINTIVNDKT